MSRLMEDNWITPMYEVVLLPVVYLLGFYGSHAFFVT